MSNAKNIEKMKTKLTQSQNLKVGNFIFHNEEKFLIEEIKPNKNNKQFLFIHTTSNKKIELPKEFFIKQIIN
jgi:translation elongation factor P/translation initiation factor 5A